jgi:hypothetical protein
MKLLLEVILFLSGLIGVSVSVALYYLILAMKTGVAE